MRKGFTLLIFVSFISISGISQDDDFYSDKSVQKEQVKTTNTEYPYSVFLGLGFGINNHCGIFGAQIEYSPIQKLSFTGGLGLSTWGYKAAIGARFYNKGFPHKVFYGLTYTTTSGVDGLEMDLETTTSSSETVEINLKPARNIAATIGYQWKLFKNGRINFEGGYSIPLQNKAYEVVSPGITLSDDSETLMQILTPGGIVLGIAFTIGL